MPTLRLADASSINFDTINLTLSSKRASPSGTSLNYLPFVTHASEITYITTAHNCAPFWLRKNTDTITHVI